MAFTTDPLASSPTNLVAAGSPGTSPPRTVVAGGSPPRGPVASTIDTHPEAKPQSQQSEPGWLSKTFSSIGSFFSMLGRGILYVLCCGCWCKEKESQVSILHRELTSSAPLEEAVQSACNNLTVEQKRLIAVALWRLDNNSAPDAPVTDADRDEIVNNLETRMITRNAAAAVKCAKEAEQAQKSRSA